MNINPIIKPYFNIQYNIQCCEDFGQAVIYKGTIGPGYESAWSLDGHHTMETGKVFPVCGNTFHMLYDTRLRKYFDFMVSLKDVVQVFLLHLPNNNNKVVEVVVVVVVDLVVNILIILS